MRRYDIQDFLWSKKYFIKICNILWDFYEGVNRNRKASISITTQHPINAKKNKFSGYKTFKNSQISTSENIINFAFIEAW